MFLFDNVIGYRGAAALATALPNLPKLMQLHMQNNHLTMAGKVLLKEAKNPGLAIYDYGEAIYDYGDDTESEDEA